MAIGRVFPNEIDRLFNAPGGPIGKEVRAVAIETARVASQIAGYKLGRNPNDKPRTGRYARGFGVRVVGRSTEFEVYNTQKYAGALELGARPHAIRARRVSHLRFRDRTGQWRTVKMVRHPGNPAFRILETAARITMRQRYGSSVVG